MPAPLPAREITASLTPMLPSRSRAFTDGTAIEGEVLRSQGTQRLDVFMSVENTTGVTAQVQFAHSSNGAGWDWRDLGGPVVLSQSIPVTLRFFFAALAYRIVFTPPNTNGQVSYSMMASS